ncbi:MAG: endopeptidase La [Nitrospirota bacterium]
MGFFKKSEGELHDEALEELRQKIIAVRMPSSVESIALQELDTLSKISPSTAEYTIGLTYIDYLVTLPWNKKTEDNLDLRRAENIMMESHYGLTSVKERILEHLAVKILKLDTPPRILVVDDEEIARKNLTHILARENYEVAVATDGTDALNKLRTTRFDVIITDLKMPGVDGMEVLENIRAQQPDTRVIMITGYATVPSAVEAMKKGAFSYIAKPFKLEEVRAAVKQALENRVMMSTTHSSVLCFAGPPGTGKTSMGRTVAKALGRHFVRIALGGMRDEAEIRGHRRTYVGAKPGRIIEEIRRVGSSNPVIMLDELDKIGHDFKGDPASALLEVLDPEQNRGFVDHYLDVPFDLSEVMFILTSNTVESIPAPLRDRMEVIEFSGYTPEEKVHIASQFIIPRQLNDKGLCGYAPEFTEEVLYKIIQEYTHESGTRNLERKIAAIFRKTAKEIVQDRAASSGQSKPLVITPALIEHYLGRPLYHYETAGEHDRVGVTTGLVLTETGGDIIFVEAARMKGRKELILTGSLGEVMRESALAALSYVRSNAAVFGIPEDFFEHHDIHIHVPSGAIQKDGPSAGITIAMALISLLTNRPARRNVAMTGEITLTGRVLQVSGIREKLAAARRAGIKAVILPSRNRPDLEELTEKMKKGMTIHFTDYLDEAIDTVLTR